MLGLTLILLLAIVVVDFSTKSKNTIEVIVEGSDDVVGIATIEY